MQPNRSTVAGALVIQYNLLLVCRSTAVYEWGVPMARVEDGQSPQEALSQCLGHRSSSIRPYHKMAIATNTDREDIEWWLCALETITPDAFRTDPVKLLAKSTFIHYDWVELERLKHILLSQSLLQLMEECDYNLTPPS
jgi:hypothetical protein